MRIVPLLAVVQRLPSELGVSTTIFLGVNKQQLCVWCLELNLLLEGLADSFTVVDGLTELTFSHLDEVQHLAGVSLYVEEEEDGSIHLYASVGEFRRWLQAFLLLYRDDGKSVPDIGVRAANSTLQSYRYELALYSPDASLPG